MLSGLTKFLLVATSIAPILLTFAFVELWAQNWLKAIALAVTAWLLAKICTLILKRASSTLPSESVSFSNVKPADREITGFVIAYLLPLAKVGGTTYNLPFLSVVLVIFFLVVLTSNAYHMNPLVGLLGYHFYEVTADGVSYVLISTNSLHHIRGKHEVVTIADYMLLEATPARP